MWTIVRTFLDALFLALSELVLRDGYAGEQGLSDQGRAELMARTLRAGAGGVSWDAFRYGPYDEAGWARLGHVFSLANEAGCADRWVGLPEGAQAASSITPKQAFVRGVAVRCAGFDRLPVESMDEVEHLIGRAGTGAWLRPHETPEALFSVRLGEGHGPCRMVRVHSVPEDAWFFAPGSDAADALPQTGAASAHLRYQWSHQLALRRHARYDVKGSLGIVQDWEALLAALSKKGGAARDVAELSNVSRGGVNVSIPVHGNDGARVGDLMGLWVDDDRTCQLGVIRRIERRSDHSMNLGIEIMTKTPALFEVDDGRAAAVGVACDPVRSGAAIRFLAEPESISAVEPVFLKLGADILKLRPVGRVFRSHSCQLQTFQVL